MRTLWTSNDQNAVTALLELLSTNTIPFSVDSEKVCDWGSDAYGTIQHTVWVVRDEDVAKAQALLSSLTSVEIPPYLEKAVPVPEKASLSPPLRSFLQQYVHLRKPSGKAPKKRFSIYTFFIIFTCSFLFTFEYMEVPPAPAPSTPPIQQMLLIDYPKALALKDAFILEGYEKEAMQSTVPYWAGFYPYLVGHFSKSPERIHIDSNLFLERVRDGDVWRLFTPALLHVNLIHLLFNMIWIVLLGTQLEARLSKIRFLWLLLIIGIASNVAQYAMAGISFMGISGVICGMAGFIHTRQRLAPWEGYPLTKETYSFLVFFVTALAAASFVSFLLECTLNISLNLGFANTAHIIGLWTGILLGRHSLFRKRDSIKAAR